MNNGYLSQYFEAVAVKKLSAVEADPRVSHQHEFNGSRELKRVIRTTERKNFQTKFLWIGGENESISDEGEVVWYDARANHESRSEFRLYYHRNEVMDMVNSGDIMFIAKRTDDTILIILTTPGSTIENQLYWLFGLESPSSNGFEAIEVNQSSHQIDFATRFILEELGIEIEEPESDKLNSLLQKFNKAFPSTAEFSNYARSTLNSEINLIEDPDNALLTLMEWEEKLFRRLERQIVSTRLQEGFSSTEGEDVDGFLQFSLSVQNRRKSRAGSAFEEHLSFIFQANNLKFSRKAQTENKAKPDFLFPDGTLYGKENFPIEYMTLLGAKTTCKDRWRQITSESKLIEEKHLITLEPGISENQTKEMQDHKVQLILPQGLHPTYSTSQQEWILNLKDFVQIVNQKQTKAIQVGLLQ